MQHDWWKYLAILHKKEITLWKIKNFLPLWFYTKTIFVNQKLQYYLWIILTISLKFVQNWFHVKSEWQKNSETSTLCRISSYSVEIEQHFLPFWFYVKSILAADTRRWKSAILAILETVNFDFWEISHLKMSKISKSSKFGEAKMLKMAVFDLLKSSNIAFT